MGGGRIMKIVFFGTPNYVIPILEKLYKYYEVVAVVTQEPKPAGRDKKIQYSPVDSWSFKKRITKLFSFNYIPYADLGVCASFGKIIPSSVINHFKFGILNIHPSLLPKYRGSSPIQTAIASGDTETGVTIIKMDEQMDHGPIVSQFKEEILPDDTFSSLRERLFEKSAQFLVDLIPNYTKGKINLKIQNESLATFTKMVKKEDGYVDLKNDSPIEIERKFRAYTPWPGIWTQITLKQTGQSKRLKILEFKDEPITVQLEGKNPVNYKQFKEAYKIF